MSQGYRLLHDELLLSYDRLAFVVRMVGSAFRVMIERRSLVSSVPLYTPILICNGPRNERRTAYRTKKDSVKTDFMPNVLVTHSSNILAINLLPCDLLNL